MYYISTQDIVVINMLIIPLFDIMEYSYNRLYNVLVRSI